MTIGYLEHAPHLRRRLLASAAFIFLLIALVIGWGGGSDPLALAAPPVPKVHPGASSLVVSWSPPPGLPEANTAEVRSYPTERPCAMTGHNQCTFEGVVDATPWRFTVRELIGGSWTPWSTPSSPAPHVSIAIVAGQSNATGWQSTVSDSTGKDVLAASSSPADAAVSIAWDQPNSVAPATVGLGPSGPVPLLSAQTLSNSSWPSLSGKKIFGPEITLARGLFAGGVKNLVVLKVTQGGSALGGGGPWSPGDGALYKALVADTHELQTWEAQQGRSATISVLSWYQGETDALTELGPSYRANLTSLITSLRRDLPTSPSTPFLIVKPSVVAAVSYEQRIGACQPAKCTTMLLGDTQVRSADDAVAATLPHVYVIDSILLPRTGMELHLSSDGELLLGGLLAKVALEAGPT